jgi:hypothetical protein
MARPIFTYTKSILERVSFDKLLFHKELNKAIQYLLPYEIELLLKWLKNFTKNKPELQGIILNLE